MSVRVKDSFHLPTSKTEFATGFSRPFTLISFFFLHGHFKLPAPVLLKHRFNWCVTSCFPSTTPATARTKVQTSITGCAAHLRLRDQADLVPWKDESRPSPGSPAMAGAVLHRCRTDPEESTSGGCLKPMAWNLRGCQHVSTYYVTIRH